MDEPERRVSVEPCLVDGEIACLVEEGDRSHVEVWAPGRGGWIRPEGSYPDVSAVLRAPPAPRDRLLEAGIPSEEATEASTSAAAVEGSADAGPAWWESPRWIYRGRTESRWGQVAALAVLGLALVLWPVATVLVVAGGLIALAVFSGGGRSA